jgi:hypothetical protein
MLVQPEDDPQLRDLLREWEVPGAPLSLNERILGRRQAWWRFLITGSIRIPVPVSVLVAIVVVGLAAAVVQDHRKVPPKADATAGNVSLKGFRPVKNAKVRIIRGAYGE